MSLFLARDEAEAAGIQLAQNISLQRAYSVLTSQGVYKSQELHEKLCQLIAYNPTLCYPQ